MEADDKATSSQDHHHHHSAPASTHSLCDYHRHPCLLPHPPLVPPPFLNRRHNHHPSPPPPIPFICARCKCWNFPVSPCLNTHSNHEHFHPSHLHRSQFHSAGRPAQVTGLYQHEDVQLINNETENAPTDSFAADGMEDVEEEDDNYEFVMTDEWIEFFAKSEARRQEKKRKQKKAARELRKALRTQSQTDDTPQYADEDCPPL